VRQLRDNKLNRLGDIKDIVNGEKREKMDNINTIRGGSGAISRSDKG